MVLPPVVLASGAGGCFGGQFRDNAFWMTLRSWFGLSTRGTSKTHTLAQSMLSVVTLATVPVIDVFVSAEARTRADDYPHKNGGRIR